LEGNTKTNEKSSTMATFATIRTTSAETGHRTLAHASPKVIGHLEQSIPSAHISKDSASVPTTSNCETCALPDVTPISDASTSAEHSIDTLPGPSTVPTEPTTSIQPARLPRPPASPQAGLISADFANTNILPQGSKRTKKHAYETTSQYPVQLSGNHTTFAAALISGHSTASRFYHPQRPPEPNNYRQPPP